MIKKVLEVAVVLMLIAFSFYYTDKAVAIVEQNDPIMKQINQQSAQYEEAAIDATIDEKYMIPGYSGLMVNTEESFQKMKQYGDYNESLLVFKEVTPAISIEEYYDRYISSGNGFTDNVALVFKVDTLDYLQEVTAILAKNNAQATFFVDGILLEDHTDEIRTLAADFYEIEILDYDGGYDKISFLGSLEKLKVLTNTAGKYCYAEYDQKEILTMCQEQKLHTIIPTMKITNNAYRTIKGNIKGGTIISFDLNKENVDELSVVIQYIKQRGFVLDTLDNLLQEGRGLEK